MSDFNILRASGFFLLLVALLTSATSVLLLLAQLQMARIKILGQVDGRKEQVGQIQQIIHLLVT